METKSLLIGLGGFILGGLVVSLAATTLQKPATPAHMTMSQMSETLKPKTGDDFDKAFLVGMIEHHNGAIDMAKLAKDNAKHDEIKQLAEDVITAQSKEIQQMESWYSHWGYKSAPH